MDNATILALSVMSLTLVDCVGVSNDSAMIDDEIEFQITREATTADDLIIKTKISNKSSKEVCVIKDTVSNPNSFGMTIDLKNKKNEKPKTFEYGIVPPFSNEEIIILPNSSIQNYFSLKDRFNLDKEWLGTSEPIYVRSKFYFWVCKTREWRVAVSGWQSI